MSEQFCNECKKVTDTVFDHAAGDVICRDCGLVLQAHSVDETAEWRTFSNESANNDPVRVGGPINPLLSDGGLSTIISKPGGGEFTGALGKWQNRGPNPDRNLINAFRAIAAMAERLSLVGTIKDRANEIYKKVEDLKAIRGRSQDATVAACLYIACRQEDKPRTLKEICAVAKDATLKEIGRCYKFIIRQVQEELGEHMELGSIRATDFLRRFGSYLGMPNKEIMAVQEVVKRAQELIFRNKDGRITKKNPISVAAAAIYMISQLSTDKKQPKDISKVVGIADATIRNSYKDLYPHASTLVPSWFASEEQVKTLPAPFEASRGASTSAE